MARKRRSLTPHITQCKFIMCHQPLTEASLTSPQLSLLLCLCISCLAQIYEKAFDTSSSKLDHSVTRTQLHGKMKYSPFKMTYRWSARRLKGTVSSIHGTFKKASQHKNAALYLSDLFLGPTYPWGFCTKVKRNSTKKIQTKQNK